MRDRARLSPEAMMNIAAVSDTMTSRQDWPTAIYRTLRDHGVAQISYVPDAGHSRLIELSHGDDAIKTTVLTTEEEGVVSCCRFDGHQDWVFHTAGGGSCRDGSSVESSRSRRSSLS